MTGQTVSAGTKFFISWGARFYHFREPRCVQSRNLQGGEEAGARLRNQGSAQWRIFFLFFQVQRSITMQPERWAKRLIARAIPFMTLGNPI
jgi:hypothetical protein